MKGYLHLPNEEYNEEISTSEIGSSIDFEIALRHYDFVLATAYKLTPSEYVTVCNAIEGHFKRNGKSLKRKKLKAGLENDGVVG